MESESDNCPCERAMGGAVSGGDSLVSGKGLFTNGVEDAENLLTTGPWKAGGRRSREL